MPDNKKTNIRAKRKNLRLKDFDYSDTNHVYFITLCARHLKTPFINIECSEGPLCRSENGITRRSFPTNSDVVNGLRAVQQSPSHSENIPNNRNVTVVNDLRVVHKPSRTAGMTRRSFPTNSDAVNGVFARRSFNGGWRAVQCGVPTVQPPLCDSNQLSEEIIKSLFHLKEKTGMALYCYCLMPDHLHIAISPSIKSGSVSKILQELKSFTTNIGWKYGLKGRLWQKSFYDHITRKGEDLVKICEYIMANPVRRGLAVKPEDWKYSGLIDPLPL